MHGNEKIKVITSAWCVAVNLKTIFEVAHEVYTKDMDGRNCETYLKLEKSPN